jgi:hypothetical protein
MNVYNMYNATNAALLICVYLPVCLAQNLSASNLDELIGYQIAAKIFNVDPEKEQITLTNRRMAGDAQAQGFKARVTLTCHARRCERLPGNQDDIQVFSEFSGLVQQWPAPPGAFVSQATYASNMPPGPRGWGAAGAAGRRCMA